MILPPPVPGSARIEGSGLVVPKNFQFPEVCLLTGRTTNLVPMRRQLMWHHPALYLCILGGLLVYVVLALLIRKTSNIRFYISREERARRRRWHAANWGVFAMTFVSFIAAGAYDVSWAIWLAPVFFVSCLVLYFVKVRYPYPKKIDDQNLTLAGVPPPVMQQVVALCPDVGLPPPLPPGFAAASPR